MLTAFLKDVCMRGYHFTSLCVICKTWIETFASTDIAGGSYENPQNPGHGGHFVRENLLNASLRSKLPVRRHRSVIEVAFQHFFYQNQDSSPHNANITHTYKSNFLSWLCTSVVFFWVRCSNRIENPRDFGVKMEVSENGSIRRLRNFTPILRIFFNPARNYNCVNTRYFFAAPVKYDHNSIENILTLS